MEKDIVSIITTCYNVSEYISKSMESVIKQETDDTFEIEYIIVNDASTDNSLEIINNIIKDNTVSLDDKDITFVIYSLQENLGCGGARKYGISKAHGQYIMFLDADDYYFNSDFVLRAHNDIISNNADIVEYGVKYNIKAGHSFDAVSKDKIILTDPELALISMFKDNVIKFNVWSKIYTKKIVDSYPYSDTRTFEDIRTVPMWVYNAKKIVIMTSVEINYRANPNSIIRENEIDTRIGTCKAICELFEHFKDNKNMCKVFYTRALIDFDYVLADKTSYNDGFDEMSKINTKMLSYIYPDTYQNITFNIPEKV